MAIQFIWIFRLLSVMLFNFQRFSSISTHNLLLHFESLSNWCIPSKCCIIFFLSKSYQSFLNIFLFNEIELMFPIFLYFSWKIPLLNHNTLPDSDIAFSFFFFLESCNNLIWWIWSRDLKRDNRYHELPTYK